MTLSVPTSVPHIVFQMEAVPIFDLANTKA